MVGDILQPTHLLFILVVALLVLGPKRLPEVGKTLGSGLRDFRQAISGDSSNPSHDWTHTMVESAEPRVEPDHQLSDEPGEPNAAQATATSTPPASDVAAQPAVASETTIVEPIPDTDSPISAGGQSTRSQPRLDGDSVRPAGQPVRQTASPRQPSRAADQPARSAARPTSAVRQPTRSAPPPARAASRPVQRSGDGATAQPPRSLPRPGQPIARRTTGAARPTRRPVSAPRPTPSPADPAARAPADPERSA